VKASHLNGGGRKALKRRSPEGKEGQGMTKVLVISTLLGFLLLGCTTTCGQTGYNPTFEKMKVRGGWSQ